MTPNKVIDRLSLASFTGFILVSIASLMDAFYTEIYVLAAIPVIIIIGFITYIDVRSIFYLMLFTLPCSIEFEVTNSLQTDLPTEPLLAGLMLVFFVYAALKPKEIDFRFYRTPIIIFLLIQFAWTIVVCVNSIEPILSLKYLLAKSWYIVPFVFMGALFLRTENDMKRFFWIIFIPLCVLTIITILRYIPLHFEFEEVNKTMVPYFRNKVSYGTTLTIFFPFLFMAAKWYEKGSWKWRLIQVSKIIFLVGIYFFYTRACILALAICAVMYVVIRWKMIQYAIPAALVLVMGFFAYMIHNNEFMSHAPVYEKTVQHDKYEDHLAATVSFEDASSMERVYMWIGGIQMYLERPIIGSGPNTFYPNYKRYTIKSFETYLSDNDEKLTMHNYYLLTLLEQGAVGLILFLAVIFTVLYMGQRAYHKLESPFHKRWAMCAMMSFVGVIVSLSLSDLIETDKVGSIYYMDIAMLANLYVLAFYGKGKESGNELEAKS
jgi:O-antigen ligase